MQESQEQWLTEMIQSIEVDRKITDKQSKILQAAVETFADKGFASASTSEIAKKAGVAEGTIFKHYKTKKDLLLAIVTPIITKMVAPFILKDFNKIFKESFSSYEDFLRAVIRNRLEFAKSNLPILKIFIQEIAFHHELQEEFKKQVASQVLDRISKVVQQFQEKDEIVDIPHHTVIRYTASSILGMLITRFILVPEKEWDDEQEIESTVYLIMNGLKKS